LDEAYVCLKLAYEFNVSRNIVEYFSAALLPGRLGPSIVQLFMEIMPSEWCGCGLKVESEVGRSGERRISLVGTVYWHVRKGILNSFTTCLKEGRTLLYPKFPIIFE